MRRSRGAGELRWRRRAGEGGVPLSASPARERRGSATSGTAEGRRRPASARRPGGGLSHARALTSPLLCGRHAVHGACHAAGGRAGGRSSASGVEATAEMAFPLPLLQRCQRRARVDHGEAEQRGGGILHHLLETRVFASLLTALYTMQNANASLFLHRIVEVSLRSVL